MKYITIVIVIYNIVTSTSIPLSALFLKIIFATLRLLSYIFMGKVVHFHKESFHDFNWDGFENIDPIWETLIPL